jgi:hypothetical protein
MAQKDLNPSANPITRKLSAALTAALQRIQQASKNPITLRQDLLQRHPITGLTAHRPLQSKILTGPPPTKLPKWPRLPADQSHEDHQLAMQEDKRRLGSKGQFDWGGVGSSAGGGGWAAAFRGSAQGQAGV